MAGRAALGGTGSPVKPPERQAREFVANATYRLLIIISNISQRCLRPWLERDLICAGAALSASRQSRRFVPLRGKGASLRFLRHVHAGGRARAFAIALCLIVDAENGRLRAGAWLMPPGEGQIIASTAFSGSARAFDANGRLIPVPSYDKFELGAYLEYGLTDWLTVIAAPAYDSIKQPAPAASYDGPGDQRTEYCLGDSFP